MSLAETVIDSLLDRKLAKPSAPAVRSEDHSLVKGLVAGVICGLAAVAAKHLVEKVYPPQGAGTADAVPEIPWAFGATTGAAYGALAEYFPVATSREGVNFGMTLMALTHEKPLPALALAAAPAGETARERSSEIASHIVYGLVAEGTRRIVRRML